MDQPVDNPLARRQGEGANIEGEGANIDRRLVPYHAFIYLYASTTVLMRGIGTFRSGK